MTDSDSSFERPGLSAVYAGFDDSTVPAGQIYRRAFHSENLDVVVFVDTATGLRGARFEFRHQAESSSTLDTFKGLRITRAQVDEAEEDLTIEQVRPGDTDLFVLVVEDLVGASVGNSNLEAQSVVSRLARWRLFFSRQADGLTRDQQLGLFGELVVFQFFLDAGASSEDAVLLWQGPHSEVHDFSSEGGALEVKSTSNAAAGIAKISNEFQLDPAELAPLFLVFLGFDVRPHGPAMTLPQKVGSVRKALAGSPISRAHFEDLLIDVGYADLHAPLYSAHYEPKREEVFLVDLKFPSLRALQLPSAVSRAKYQLNVDRCQEWRTTRMTALGALAKVVTS